MKIIKEELQFEESLKQRLEFICEFAKVTPKFINGSIRKIENTNLSYIEPHRVVIKDTTFLVFNYSNDVYISNLSKKIKLSELEEYLKSLWLVVIDISVKIWHFWKLWYNTYRKLLMSIIKQELVIWFLENYIVQ